MRTCNIHSYTGPLVVTYLQNQSSDRTTGFQEPPDSKSRLPTALTAPSQPPKCPAYSTPSTQTPTSQTYTPGSMSSPEGSAGIGLAICAHLLQHNPERIYLLGKKEENPAEATETPKKYADAQ